MLSQIDRRFVELVKHARNIRITANYGCDDELTLCFNDNKSDIRKLTHDVALAVQDQLRNTRG